MAFKFNHIGEYKEREDRKTPSSPSLSKQEIEYLLMHISEGTFKGQEVEQIFYLVLKLQEMYMHLEEVD